MRLDRRKFIAGSLSAGVLGATHAASAATPATSTAQPMGDWLIDPAPYKARIVRDVNAKQIALANGLVQRTFSLVPNAATTAIDNLMTGQSELRTVRPEAVLVVNDNEISVGGLTGQPVHNYFRPEWIATMAADPCGFQLDHVEEAKIVERFAWKRVQQWSTADLPWPPPGVALIFHYKAGPQSPIKDLSARVHYELYDGIPLMAKWLELDNHSASPIVVNAFKAEVLALAECYATKYAPPESQGALLDKLVSMHIETDYAFGGHMQAERDNPAVRWVSDPLYHSDDITLLEVAPRIGPEAEVAPNDTFRSFTVFELLHDSTEAERRGLAMRRMMSTLAPWSQENPMYMHIRYAEPEKIRFAIDQCATVGFEMVMLSFGSGFDIQNDSPDYLAQMKSIADYARAKGVAIGGYTLLASRGGKDEDLIIDVHTGVPGGGRFGPSPCLCSNWADEFFKKCHAFLAATGMNVFLNDGSYPGDTCASTHHPGHKGYLDSQWRQWQTIIKLYRWCRAEGIYLKVPDWYFLNGSSKTGMGYTETDWSYPKPYQPVIERQDIYDGTFERTPSMGWMHVPLVQYHGGGEAATVEPLDMNRAHYQQRFEDLLGAGVQATWRGTRLYDTDETLRMVKQQVDFYKQYRAILNSDIIHLRRADGRDWDGILHINPSLSPRAMALLYNPLDQPITRTIALPLYYTGLTTTASIRIEGAKPQICQLDRNYCAVIHVTIPPRGQTWLTVKE
ncbi:MAG: hypothetical protein V4555_19675 [Acidobacteriota bacterium]